MFFSTKVRNLSLLFVGGTMLFTSCVKDEEPVVSVNPLTDELKTAAVQNFVDVTYAVYDDAYQKAVEMKSAIDGFVAAPSQSTFDAAKASWLAARNPYGETETYRFFDSPIDDADGPEGALNAWPLDENYIDYVKDASGNIVSGGIVNDATTYPTIDAATLESLNEQGSEKNVSIGYHAIEFLLWGQDFVDVTVNEGQGGDRAYTDYTTADNAARRGQYLQVCATLLVDHLKSVRDEWASNGAYRSTFLALSKDEALTKMLTGAGILSKSELAGERMFVALETNAADNPQEDEHSCFSDNTHNDIIRNAMGINNVLSGTYTTTAGVTVGDPTKSIVALVAVTDSDKSVTLTTKMAEAMAKVNAIPVPFDKTVTNEVVSANGTVEQAVNALVSQGDYIAEAATTLGLSVSTALPE